MSIVPCSDCGELISSSAAMCPKCGANLGATQTKWKSSEWISMIGTVISFSTLVLGAVGAYVAYHEFILSDNWKRREFVSAQIKDFYSDKVNGNVLALLDYNPATVELYPNKEKAADRVKSVYFKDLVSAIRDEDNLVGDRLLIRQQFEHFLQSLARFDYLSRYDAVRLDELCSDLEYPVSLLAGDPHAQEMKQKNSGIDILPLATAMRDYIARWNNVGIRRFMTSLSRACGFKTPYFPT